MAMKYMYITNQPQIAMIADEIGIDRVWIDLEKLGKEERQRNFDSVKSQHSVEDVLKIKKILKHAKLQVRINPINPQSANEIEQVLDFGADLIMLPYYKTLKEVETFLNIVKNRAITILLLETQEADTLLSDTLKYSEINEIYIGLNDLHLSYHKKFMFELLTDGTVERLCKQIKLSELPYGFGGIARLGYGALPAEYILPEHFRLGSTRAILSRSFFNVRQCNDEEKAYEIMRNGITELRIYEKLLENKCNGFFEKNHQELQERVRQIVYDG